MTKIGEIFYDDDEYTNRVKWCNENNCHIEEIEPDEKGRRFKIVKNEDINEDLSNQNELYELRIWFDTYYSQHCEKYQRLIRLNKFTDDGALPKDALLALDYEAERKRKRIQELEKIVEE